VHQVIRDRAGTIISDKIVNHTYSFGDGRIRGMEIEAA
jgi:hypothetical protein